MTSKQGGAIFELKTSLINNPDFVGQTEIIDTNCGPIAICRTCKPPLFGNLRIDAGLGHFSHYSSIIHRIDDFETIASQPGGRVTLGIDDPNIIIGYCVGLYPAPKDRWAALGDLMYELAAVEISRNYRGCKLGEKIIGATLAEDFFEDKIAYMCGYSWHWDLEGKGLSAVQHRSMMKHLYSKFGFREVYTNEPNITLRAENIMMIRVGSRVKTEDQMKFRHLRFGIKPSIDNGKTNK
ncbi:MAG: N-acetyltransferase [Pseudomonadota bacterium]